MKYAIFVTGTNGYRQRVGVYPGEAIADRVAQEFDSPTFVRVEVVEVVYDRFEGRYVEVEEGN